MIKRRIIKGQKGIPNLNPATEEEYYLLMQDRANAPETGMQKAARYTGYALDPIGAATDYVTEYVQKSSWAPRWLKRIFPFLGPVATAASYDGPYKLNGWSKRGANKNASNYAKWATIELGEPMAKSGFRKKGRGKNREGNEDYDPDDVIWDENVEKRNRTYEDYADKVRKHNHKVRSAPKNKPKETPPPAEPRKKTKNEEMMERLKQQNERSKQNNN